LLKKQASFFNKMRFPEYLETRSPGAVYRREKQNNLEILQNITAATLGGICHFATEHNAL